jgi:hypothetical protein
MIYWQHQIIDFSYSMKPRLALLCKTAIC